MILVDKLPKAFEACSSKLNIPLKCDYCGKEFFRIKKSIISCNKNLQKDSCDSKDCKKKKRLEVNAILKLNPDYQKKYEKTKQSNLEKYGCESYFQTQKFKDQRKKVLIEKYGTTSLLLNEDILNKHKATCLERYGVDNYSKTDEFYDKVIATNLDRYGEKSAMLNEEVLQKRKKTSLEKYGKENYTQTEQYIENRKKLWLEVYGVEHTSQLPETIEKMKKTCLERYGVTNYAKTDEFKEKYVKICLAKYGVPNPLLKKNQIYGKNQAELQEWLNSFGFNFQSDYTILSPKEIDLFDEKIGIAIEYCGLFWHTELSPTPRLKTYHYDKYMNCLNQNVRLITIFEDEWLKNKEKCQNRLKSILKIEQNKIFARKCEIKELSKKEFNDLCEKYHMQGSNNLGFVFYGLVYQGEIVAGISLGRHHRNKDIVTLDRLCFKENLNVVGGSSKLFSACINYAKHNNVREIISWSDNRWSQGNVYKQLGFSLDKELGPDYSYINLKKPYYRLSKQSQKKSNTNCPEDKTEYEWAIENGLARLWDCGKKRWKFFVK